MKFFETLKSKITNQTIYPFEAYYAKIDMLDSKQLKSYQYISEQIIQGNKVDIEGNISYLFVFLFETTRELLYSQNYKIALEKISRLQELYGNHSSLNGYCDQSMADILLCAGNHRESLQIMEQAITGKATAKFSANMLINLKHKFGGQIKAEELLSTASKLTQYGKENVDDILRIMNILLDEAYQRDSINIIEEIVTDEMRRPSKKGELILFVGNPYGYDLNKHLVTQDLKWDYISFFNNEKFIHFIKELSRISENMLRESKGLPKVNEGWLNETKLYYAIKETFSQYNVIHQYRCKWLGLQSLDIFIDKLNIGIEYQGAQHIMPMDFFGGEEAFKKTQQRDKKKKNLCDKNGVKLIYVYEGYNLEDVLAKINSYISENKQDVQLQATMPPSHKTEAEISSVDLKTLLDNAPAEDRSPNEKQFLDSFFKKLEQNNLKQSLLTWNRLSDKILNISYNGSQIGRIKLTGRKTKMQILTDESVTWIESQSLDAYIQEQDKWIEHLKSLSIASRKRNI